MERTVVILARHPGVLSSPAPKFLGAIPLFYPIGVLLQSRFLEPDEGLAATFIVSRET
jgi:hypothetical protein